MCSTETNRLYLGNNLQLLREHVPDSSVDLVYLDPPFNSKAHYSMFLPRGGQTAPATGDKEQMVAFSDTWQWDPAAEATYDELMHSGSRKLAGLIRNLRDLLGPTDMLAYLSMMAIRLVELYRVLQPTGSLFLHCDPTASHYLKLVLDAVFGPRSFRNEIIWHYDYGARSKKTFGKKHDVIFWYSVSAKTWTFHADAVLEPYQSKMTEWRYTRGGQAGKPMPGGKVPSDVWEIKLNAMSAERVGYPTQKPAALLERIILAGSSQGDLILDPFCGSGTTMVVAQRLGRRWIGMDSAPVAISLTKQRLQAAAAADGRQDST